MITKKRQNKRIEVVSDFSAPFAAYFLYQTCKQEYESPNPAIYLWEIPTSILPLKFVCACFYLVHKGGDKKSGCIK